MSVYFAIEFPIIVPYFGRRGRRGTKCLQSAQAALFLLFAGSISFLTWAGVEGGVHPLYTVSAFALIVVFVLFIAYVHRDFPVARTKFQCHSIQIGIVFYFIMLPGLICFALSYLKTMETSEYKTQDMIIQNSRLEFDGAYPCVGNKNKNCGAYKARINVNWGKEWACPENPGVWCDAWITESDCIVHTDKSVSTQDEFAGNFADVEKCVMEKYGIPAVGTELSEDEYPELQDKWPTIQFLGTCTCSCSTAPLDTHMYKYVKRIKLAGLCLSCSGALLFAIYYFIIFDKSIKNWCARFMQMVKESFLGRFFQSDGTANTTTHASEIDIENATAGRTAERIAQINEGQSSQPTEASSHQTAPPMAEASILENESSVDGSVDDGSVGRVSLGDVSVVVAPEPFSSDDASESSASQEEDCPSNNGVSVGDDSVNTSLDEYRRGFSVQSQDGDSYDGSPALTEGYNKPTAPRHGETEEMDEVEMSA
eukprot:scaffold2003_cov139-Cylindrotheca_fusiformis.AAC.6